MIRRTALAIALTLGLVAGANAANLIGPVSEVRSGNNWTVDFGPIALGSSYGSYLPHNAGSFVDQLRFHITQSTFATGFVSSVNIGAIFDIPALNVKLFQSDSSYATANDLAASFTGNGTPNVMGAGLYSSPGYYFFEVAGTADGSNGGQYVYNGVTAVPEPESYAMLLAGLALMGAIARCRSKTISV